MIYYPFVFRACFSNVRFSPEKLKNLLGNLSYSNQLIYHKGLHHDFAYVYANHWKEKNASIRIVEHFENNEEATIYSKKGQFWTFSPIFHVNFLKTHIYQPTTMEVQILLHKH